LDRTDPTGKIAGVDDAVVLGAVALTAVAVTACGPGTACAQGVADALTSVGEGIEKADDAISQAHQSLVTKIVDGIVALIDRLLNNAIMAVVPQREHTYAATQGFC
jgi:hypothetical protein